MSHYCLVPLAKWISAGAVSSARLDIPVSMIGRGLPFTVQAARWQPLSATRVAVRGSRLAAIAENGLQHIQGTVGVNSTAHLCHLEKLVSPETHGTLRLFFRENLLVDAQRK